MFVYLIIKKTLLLPKGNNYNHQIKKIIYNLILLYEQFKECMKLVIALWQNKTFIKIH